MARNDTLILEVSDFKDLQHWRRVLKDSMGKFRQDFEVSLNSNATNYTAFQDLYGFLEANSSPDRWLEDQVKLLRGAPLPFHRRSKPAYYSL